MTKHRTGKPFWVGIVAVATVAVSCAPSASTQKVSFVLNLGASRLNNVDFTVAYAAGSFAGTDGGCVVGPEAAGPAAASFTVTPAKRAGTSDDAAAAAASTTTTAASSTTSSTSTTLVATGACGDGHIDADKGEKCDDGNVVSGDGCDANCQPEFSFSAVDDKHGTLTIHVVNGLGLIPGSTLAICRFQFDGVLTKDTLKVTTVSCGRANGGNCNPTTGGKVKVSTTTTTTTIPVTTTTVKTSTTLAPTTTLP